MGKSPSASFNQRYWKAVSRIKYTWVWKRKKRKNRTFYFSSCFSLHAMVLSCRTTTNETISPERKVCLMSVYRLFLPLLRLLLLLFVGVACVGKSSSKRQIQRGDRLPDEWKFRKVASLREADATQWPSIRLSTK